MKHEIIALPGFSCLGLEHVGRLAECRAWIPGLWTEFLRRGNELPVHPETGRWGLMSDDEVHLAPWGGERGRYLAGIQVPEGTPSSGDWKVWAIPALHWMRIPCLVHQIGEGLAYAQRALKGHPQWCWEGSVHEHYPPGFMDPATDTFHLMVGVVPR